MRKTDRKQERDSVRKERIMFKRKEIERERGRE